MKYFVNFGETYIILKFQLLFNISEVYEGLSTKYSWTDVLKS